jgi:acetyltransferase-like isoleucine patch superfamily enzyme
VLRRIYRRIFDSATSGGPYLSHPDRIFGVGQAVIDPTARIVVRGDASGSTGRIMFGQGVYLGRHVELAAPACGQLSIGEETSVQDFCVIHGDVAIGSHCLFSMNNMISSTIHRFRDHPEWLIRDQDSAMQIAKDLSAESYSKPIVIEDDCWFGWNVAVMPGVYVGRGSVIGANCVLTKDVGPYEIHGGVPNKRIGLRLQFQPPSSLSATDDGSIPYFYRGFRVGQSALARSRARGVVDVDSSASLVLKQTGAAVFRLSGVRNGNQDELNIRIRLNGADYGLHAIEPGPFTLSIPISDVPSTSGPVSPVPNVLGKFTYIELDVVGKGCATQPVVPAVGCYGISSATLLG